MTSRPDYRSLSRRARILSAVAAIPISWAIIIAVLAPFNNAGTTPWFMSEQDVLVHHCEGAGAPVHRHACLRAAARQLTPTRVATR